MVSESDVLRRRATDGDLALQVTTPMWRNPMCLTAESAGSALSKATAASADAFSRHIRLIRNAISRVAFLWLHRGYNFLAPLSCASVHGCSRAFENAFQPFSRPA